MSSHQTVPLLISDALRHIPADGYILLILRRPEFNVVCSETVCETFKSIEENQQTTEDIVSYSIFDVNSDVVLRFQRKGLCLCGALPLSHYAVGF